MNTVALFDRRRRLPVPPYPLCTSCTLCAAYAVSPHTLSSTYQALLCLCRRRNVPKMVEQAGGLAVLEELVNIKGDMIVKDLACQVGLDIG